MQGVPQAQTVLGLMHAFGEGVPHSYAEAAYWYRRAAEQGYAPAQYNLAELYSVGYGVPRDIEHALRWMDRAAQQGHERAVERLPVLLTSPGSSTLAPPEPRAAVLTASSLGTRWSARSIHLVRALGVQRVALRAQLVESTIATQSAGNLPPSTSTDREVRAAAGAFQVQVSALRSENGATELLARLFGEHRDLLGALEGAVERADLGDQLGVWYRVRLGTLPTRAAAEQFCERMIEQGPVSGCMPVTMVQ